MRQLGLLVLVIAIGGAFVWSFMRPQSDLLLSGAVAVPMGDGGMYMVGVAVENAGPAEILTGVAAPGAQMAHVMGGDGPLAIPAGGTGIFAMDGAHIMVRGAFDGGFIPLNLSFESGATVATRAKITEGMMMDHSMANGVQEDPAPQLSIAIDGQTLRVTTENFTMVRTEDMADHVPGEGHAHLYLNGLKLARLYDSAFEIGDLPSGDYTLRVSLNTHDHRPYLSGSTPVSETLTLTVP